MDSGESWKSGKVFAKINKNTLKLSEKSREPTQKFFLTVLQQGLQPANVIREITFNNHDSIKLEFLVGSINDRKSERTVQSILARGVSDAQMSWSWEARWLEFVESQIVFQVVAPWCSGYRHCTASLNKAWTQVLCRFKSCSQRVGDTRWWGYVTIAFATHSNQNIFDSTHFQRNKEWYKATIILIMSFKNVLQTFF